MPSTHTWCDDTQGAGDLPQRHGPSFRARGGHGVPLRALHKIFKLTMNNFDLTQGFCCVERWGHGAAGIRDGTGQQDEELPVQDKCQPGTRSRGAPWSTSCRSEPADSSNSAHRSRRTPPRAPPGRPFMPLDSAPMIAVELLNDRASPSSSCPREPERRVARGTGSQTWRGLRNAFGKRSTCFQ